MFVNVLYKGPRARLYTKYITIINIGLAYAPHIQMFVNSFSSRMHIVVFITNIYEYLVHKLTWCTRGWYIFIARAQCVRHVQIATLFAKYSFALRVYSIFICAIFRAHFPCTQYLSRAQH